MGGEAGPRGRDAACHGESPAATGPNVGPQGSHVVDDAGPIPGPGAGPGCGGERVGRGTPGEAAVAEAARGANGEEEGAGGGGAVGAGGLDVDGLTPRQETALIALLHHPTLKHAAEACGIGERTLHTWLRTPAFRRAYRAARRESFAHAVGICQRYAAHAVQALARVMTDPSAGPASVVAAATALLKFSREAIELDDLAERVEALEAAAAGPRAPGAAR